MSISPPFVKSLIASHLPERRPFFLLLLHIGVVAGVLRVIARVAVGVEDVGCAEFVQRSEGDTRSIPESHSAILMAVITTDLK